MGTRTGAGAGTGTETGTRTGMETRGRTQDGNGNASGDGNESSSGDENKGEDGNGDGKESMIGKGGREPKKRKKPHKCSRRYVQNRGHVGGKRKKRRQQMVGSVADNPDNVENRKEGDREYTKYPGLT